MLDAFPAFAEALKAQRDALNARFVQRVRGGVQIDGDSFLAHLRDRGAPLVQAVHVDWPERVPAVMNGLFDASLDLFAASVLGPSGKIPAMDRVWTELLPRSIKLLAREPVGMIGCLCNGAFRVAQHRGGKLDLWLDRMLQTLPLCESLGRVLETGQIAAWQAGLVQYRSAALDVADRLPANVTAQSLGLPATTSPIDLANALARLRQDPWLIANAAFQPVPASLRLSFVGQPGSFTGFGGVFARPPIVKGAGGQLMVSDGSSHWQFSADAYGNWFRRVPDDKQAGSKLPAGVVVGRGGNLQWGSLSLAAPHLAGATGTACDGVTLAVTIPTSHHVFLFARVGGPP